MAVRQVNVCLSGGDASATARALSAPSLRLGKIHPEAATLYHSELGYVRDGSGADLRHEGIHALAEFLNLVAAINLAVIGRNPEDVWRRMTANDVNLEDLDAAHKGRYCQELLSALKKKGPDQMLTHAEVQAVIDGVNEAQVQSGTV